MGIGGTEKIIMQLCKGFNNEFNNIVVCSKGGVHVNELKELGIKHYTIPDFQDKSIKNIIKTIIKITKIIKNEDIDIVHTHHRMAAFYMKIIKIFKKITIMHTSHNTFTDKKKFTKFILSKNNVVSVGKKVQENLIDYYGIPKDTVDVIYNGVELDYKSKSKLDEFIKLKEEGYFLVTNIGRLSKQKGMEYFIKAAVKVKHNLKKVKFFIVGSGELEEELKNLTKKLKLENDIIFLGYRTDINNIIRHSDLIVLSSLWEGLPLTPIEAFMEKKTIVATDVDGTSEIVENNVNGILVEPGQYEYLSEAILKLANSNEMRYNMENEAYKTYLNKFTKEKFIESYNLYYQRLINKEEY